MSACGAVNTCTTPRHLAPATCPHDEPCGYAAFPSLPCFHMLGAAFVCRSFPHFSPSPTEDNACLPPPACLFVCLDCTASGQGTGLHVKPPPPPGPHRMGGYPSSTPHLELAQEAVHQSLQPLHACMQPALA